MRLFRGLDACAPASVMLMRRDEDRVGKVIQRSITREHPDF